MVNYPQGVIGYLVRSTMMKVKIFSEVVILGGDGDSSPEGMLEAKINGWLSGNPHIAIQDIRFDMSVIPSEHSRILQPTSETAAVVCVILYKEAPEQRERNIC
jgi:hypothetical protein